MWVVKFKFDGGEVFFGQLAKKFNLNLTGYPISNYEKNNRLFLNLIGTIRGEKVDKENLIKSLKKSKYVVNLDENNWLFNLLIREDKKFKPFYSPFFIYISPIKIDSNGTYSYHLGSWNREEITKLLNFIERNYNYKLLNLKQENITNISILGIQPALTKKQRNAYELAVKKGYYEYPKKIELKQLAKLSGISYSTFQQHLKYAEKKISEFFTGKY
jgi:predicted DNA binding protein